MALERSQKRDLRRGRVRRKVRGTDERPRLSVYRSLHHIYVQVISDDSGRDPGVGFDARPKTCARLTQQAQRRGGQGGGQSDRRSMPRKGYRTGGIRPQWLSLSRTGQGAGGSGA